jgi:small subunit ribosomal protein S5
MYDMAEEKNKKSLAVGKQQEPVEEFSESVLSVRRVAKVIRGGRRFAFSALVVVGDKKGKVGIALGKSRDVSAAISKALRKARKHMVTVPLYKTTIPYTVTGKHSASKVIIRSAAKGTGVIAGGAVRSVMEAIGVRDVLSKVIGASNSQNVVKATMNALSKLRSAQQIAHLRGKTVKEIVGNNNVAAQ